MHLDFLNLSFLFQKNDTSNPGSMGCLGDCWDVGPPPDYILFLPPPPAPAFLQASLPDLISNTTPCSSTQLCDSWAPVNKIPDREDYLEMPRKGTTTENLLGN